jgi:Phage derived protein Gp49-like (DUF891)
VSGWQLAWIFWNRWGSLSVSLLERDRGLGPCPSRVACPIAWHAIRVFYAFDPQRDAIVLIGGDKTGVSTDRFYREYVPQAERILREYLAEIEEEDYG